MGSCLGSNTTRAHGVSAPFFITLCPLNVETGRCNWFLRWRLPAQSGLNASQRRLGFEPSSRRPIGWAPGPHGFRPRTSGAKPTAKMRAGGSNTIEFSTHFALVSLNFMHPDR
jgi:hypothetical protein